jgi:hypothetical protein
MNWKKVVVPQLRYYSAIYLDRLRKTMKNISLGSWCPGQDMKQAHPKYISTITTRFFIQF